MKFECKECGKVFMHAAILSVAKSATETLEVHVCPFCCSKVIDEIALDKRIESIMSVKINEADALIKQGYEVKDTYASTVTLVKYTIIEKPKTETLQERQDMDKDATQLRKDLASFANGGDQERH